MNRLTLTTEWQYQVNNGKWVNAGKTSNTLYLLWGTPNFDMAKVRPLAAARDVFPNIVVQKVYERDSFTVFDGQRMTQNVISEPLAYLGSAFGKGKSKPAEVFDNIWKNFEGLAVSIPYRDKKGEMQLKPLYYYKDWPSKDQTTGATPFLQKFLSTGDGQCTAWADLLLGILATQGMAVDGPLGVVQGYGVRMKEPILGKKKGAQPNGFLVGNWAFGKENMPGEEYPYRNSAGTGFVVTGFFGGVYPPYKEVNGGWEYRWAGNPAVTYVGGCGQYNANPFGLFNNHVIVKIADKYYDPSYGLIYKDAADLQKQAIPGFYLITTDKNSIPIWIGFRKAGEKTEIEFYNS